MRVTGPGHLGRSSATAPLQAPARPGRRARHQLPRHRRQLRPRGFRARHRRGALSLPRRARHRHQGRAGAAERPPLGRRRAPRASAPRARRQPQALARRAHRPVPAPCARSEGALRRLGGHAGRTAARRQDPSPRRLQRRPCASSSRRAASRPSCRCRTNTTWKTARRTMCSPRARRRASRSSPGKKPGMSRSPRLMMDRPRCASNTLATRRSEGGWSPRSTPVWLSRACWISTARAPSPWRIVTLVTVARSSTRCIESRPGDSGWLPASPTSVEALGASPPLPARGRRLERRTEA